MSRTAATTAMAWSVVSAGRPLAVRWAASTLAGGHGAATAALGEVDVDGAGCVVVGAAVVEGAGAAGGAGVGRAGAGPAIERVTTRGAGAGLAAADGAGALALVSGSRKTSVTYRTLPAQ